MNHLPTHISEWKQLDNFQYLRWCKYGIIQRKSKSILCRKLSKVYSLAIIRGKNSRPDEAFWRLNVLPGELPLDPWSESSHCEWKRQPWPQIWSKEPPAKSPRVVPILGLQVMTAWVGAITGPWTRHGWMMAGIGDEQVEKGTEMSPNVACEGHVIYFLSLGLASYSWYPQFPLHLPRIFTQVSPS